MASIASHRGSIFPTDTSGKHWDRLISAKRTLIQEEYAKRKLRKGRSDDNEEVVLNVGGKIFRTRRLTLRNVPNTKLALLNERSKHYNRFTKQFFFDRNPFLFGYILDFYRTGTMHLPSRQCSNAIREEMIYWELGDGCIAECCRKSYFDELQGIRTFEIVKAEFYSLPTYEDDTPSEALVYGGRWWQHLRTKCWVLIDNHESSLPAKMFALVYYGLIILSIVNLFVCTLPASRHPLQQHLLIRDRSNTVTPPSDYTRTLSKTSIIYKLLTTDPPDALVIIDLMCLWFFTVEFVFRMSVCPDVRYRITTFYTILDLCYLLPAWIKLIFDLNVPFYWQRSSRHAYVLAFLDAMLVSRVFRIFRLSRHYRGLRVLLLSIKASMGEFLLLIVFVSLTVIIFASVIYCAEQFEDEGQFENAFKGLWWCLITLTTVGYGDTYPTGTIGRLVASICAIAGLLIIGMVIPIIASNFHLYYGFRTAGCETFDLYKPEFVPSENENPTPDLTMELFKPIRHSVDMTSKQLKLRRKTNAGLALEQLAEETTEQMSFRSTTQNENKRSTSKENKRPHSVSWAADVIPGKSASITDDDILAPLPTRPPVLAEKR